MSGIPKMAAMLTTRSTYTNNITGAVIDYYEIEVKSAKKQIYPNLAPAEVYTYDGYTPGPTFKMHKGRGKTSEGNLDKKLKQWSRGCCTGY